MNIGTLAKEDNDKLNKRHCPICNSQHFVEGPSGGHAVNIACENGHRFWFAPPFTAEYQGEIKVERDELLLTKEERSAVLEDVGYSATNLEANMAMLEAQLDKAIPAIREDTLKELLSWMGDEKKWVEDSLSYRASKTLLAALKQGKLPQDIKEE